jgi:hypothetical protein
MTTDREHEGQTDDAPTTVATASYECVDPELGQLLPFHADGSLGDADRRPFAAHLKACARCSDEERLMREVARGIASLRLDPDAAAAVEPMPSGRRRGRIVPLALIAVAAAALAAWMIATPRRSAVDARLAEVRALERRVRSLEEQDASLAHEARVDARAEAFPLAGVRIATPPNL